MKRFLVAIIFAISFLVLAPPSQAGCVTAALCDAVGPGACAWTCNGGEPCKVSNTGWVTAACPPSCTCYENSTGEELGACSIDGSVCGGLGSNPYSAGSSYGTCDCFIPASCPGASPVPYCEEVPYEPCCNAGTPLPSGSPAAEFCGDTICNGAIGENTTTCVPDCGSPPAICGDTDCNGGESCSSCPGDCGGACPGGGDVCNDNICGTSESCSSCPGDCGACPVCNNNGTCAGSETCSNCAADCGACAPTCGDLACTGFEDCNSCAGDCGACPIVANAPWWQASNGHVFAGSTASTVLQSQISDTYCISPTCIAQLITPDSTANTDSEGVAITGGGVINTMGFTNTGDVQATGSRPTRFLENYAFFYRNSNLGLNPADDFAGQNTDILKPSTTKEAYFHRGSVTLQTPWVVNSGESYTVFIDGNLNISDPTTATQLTSVAEGGFLAFIVSGNITVDETVGNETLTNTTPNLEGIFVADGLLSVESRGAGLGDERFIGEGSFISWTRVALDRDFDDGGSGATENQDKPTEAFTFRPDFVKNTPAFLTRPHSLWQESN